MISPWTNRKNICAFCGYEVTEVNYRKHDEKCYGDKDILGYTITLKDRG